MTYTAFGPVPDIVTDPTRLVADLRALLTDLLALTGGGLAEVANSSLGGELSQRAGALFDELRVLSYTAGASELPCCEGDDDEAVASWANTVTTIASTGQLAA